MGCVICILPLISMIATQCCQSVPSAIMKENYRKELKFLGKKNFFAYQADKIKVNINQYFKISYSSLRKE